MSRASTLDYQKSLVVDVLQDAVLNDTIPPSAATEIQQRVAQLNSPEEIDSVWSELDSEYELFSTGRSVANTVVSD